MNEARAMAKKQTSLPYELETSFNEFVKQREARLCAFLGCSDNWLMRQAEIIAMRSDKF